MSASNAPWLAADFLPRKPSDGDYGYITDVLGKPAPCAVSREELILAAEDGRLDSPRALVWTTDAERTLRPAEVSDLRQALVRRRARHAHRMLVAGGVCGALVPAWLIVRHLAGTGEPQPSLGIELLLASLLSIALVVSALLWRRRLRREGASAGDARHAYWCAHQSSWEAVLVIASLGVAAVFGMFVSESEFSAAVRTWGIPAGNAIRFPDWRVFTQGSLALSYASALPLGALVGSVRRVAHVSLMPLVMASALIGGGLTRLVLSSGEPVAGLGPAVWGLFVFAALTALRRRDVLPLKALAGDLGLVLILWLMSLGAPHRAFDPWSHVAGAALGAGWSLALTRSANRIFEPPRWLRIGGSLAAVALAATTVIVTVGVFQIWWS